ncbi:MAG TPA: hypothetical protein VF600_17340 [Abditibacteriaceae bacterium]|jgi:hypothetical protein
MFLFRWLHKRWFGIALFAAIWFVVLCVPQLRLLFSVQTKGSSLGLQQYPWTPRFEDEAFSPEKLAQQYPNDLDILLMKAHQGNSKAGTQAIDALLRRFPNDKLLIAVRLKRSLGWMRHDRLAGDLSNPNPPPYATPSPEKSTTPPNFTPQELQRAISVVQRGRQLEPDNSYYDWALIYFYMAAYRDEDAYRVLSKASRKPRFDDHSYDETISTIAAYEKVRPLLWEEKLGFSSAVTLPHYAKYRDVARLISWQMWKAEQRGEHARAIAVRSDFARMCQPMMQGRNIIIAGLVGRACQAIMWMGNPKRQVRNNQRPSGMSTAAWGRLRGRRSAQNFATYARAHGRADIAAEVMRLTVYGQRFQNASRNYSASLLGGEWFGVPSTLRSQIISLLVPAQVSLLQIVSLVSLCCFVWMVTLFSQPAPLQRYDVLLSTLAGAAIAAISAVVGLRIAIGALSGSTVAQSQKQIFAAIICVFIFALAPLIGSALIPWGITLWRMWQQRAELFAPAPARYEGESARHLTRDYLPLALTLCILALGIIAIGCWMAALVAWITDATVWVLPFGSSAGEPPITIGAPAQFFAGFGALLTFMLYIGWLIKWRWFAPLKLRPLLHGALVWHRQTLITYVIVSSLFYLLLSIAALGPRREADARFNTYLQRGEIALLNMK